MKTSAKKNKRTGSASRSRGAKRGSVSLRKPAAKKSQRTRKTQTQKSSPKAKRQEESPNDQMKKYFHDLLKDTLNAEKQLVKALPKLAKASTSSPLKKAFEKHLNETEKQVSRIEKVFASCGLKIAGKKCEAMEGLVKEGTEAIEETPKGSLVRDVALIVAAQKVEHYEMAAYGSLRNIAMILGFEKAAELLQKTLEEEEATDKKLTDISDSLNPAAGKSSTTSRKTQKSVQASGSNSDDTKEEEDIEEAVYLDADEEEEGEGEGTPANQSNSGFGNSL